MAASPLLHIHSRLVHIRPRKLARDPKEKIISDSGTHIDEFEGGICQASSAIKADLDATLSPQKPISTIEAQRMFDSIAKALPTGLYSFLVISFVDIITLLKRNGLVPSQNAEGVLAQWLCVPDRQLKESDLAMRFGAERWSAVKAVLEGHLEMLDEKRISPTIRRIEELGLKPLLWKNFLRNAMLYIFSDRYHRRQLAEVFLAIRNGTVPAEAPLAGDFNHRSVTLAKLLLGISREFGSNTLAEFALDLLHDSNVRPSFSIIKEVMHANGANRRRYMDVEIRGSGELKQHLKVILTRYIPRLTRERQANFELNILGKNTQVHSGRIMRPSPVRKNPEAEPETSLPQHLLDARKEALQEKSFASEGEKEREESFIIQNILPSLGSDFFRNQSTTRENYPTKSVSRLAKSLLTPTNAEEEAIFENPLLIDTEKYNQKSMAEKRKEKFLQVLRECQNEALKDTVVSKQSANEHNEKDKLKNAKIGTPTDPKPSTSTQSKPSSRPARQGVTKRQKEEITSFTGSRKEKGKGKASKMVRRRTASKVQRTAFAM